MLGAGDDWWRATHPRLAPEPPRLASGIPGSPPSEDSSRASQGIRPEAGLIVDLNRADAAELDRLPGIGPVLARRIVEYRTRHGHLSRCEELLAVPGIGPRLLERVRPHVSL